jgi:hypothetical protein
MRRCCTCQLNPAFLFEITDAPGTHQQVQLAVKMFAYPLAGNRLFHGHIDAVGFHAVSVLRRLYEPCGKFGGYPPAVFILPILLLLPDLISVALGERNPEPLLRRSVNRPVRRSNFLHLCFILLFYCHCLFQFFYKCFIL